MSEPSRTITAFWPGCAVDLLALKPEDIDFGVIADHLSRQNRFAGGTRRDQPPYSVAQHSVRVMDYLPRHARAYGLLHDSPEGLCNELTAPAWAALDALSPVPGAVRVAQQALHERILHPIYTAAGLRWPSPEIDQLVHEADRQACSDELAALCGVDPTDYGFPAPTTRFLRVESEDDARRFFVGALEQCGITTR